MSKKTYKKHTSVPVTPQKKAPKWSFWAVLLAIIYLFVGSTLGILSFVRASKSDSRTARAYSTFAEEETTESDNTLNVVEFPNLIDFNNFHKSSTNWTLDFLTPNFCSFNITSGSCWVNVLTIDVTAGQKYYFYLSSPTNNFSQNLSFVFMFGNSVLATTKDVGFLPVTISETGSLSLYLSFSEKYSVTFPFSFSGSLGLYNISDVDSDTLFNSLAYSVGKLDGYDNGYKFGYSDGYGVGVTDFSSSKGFFDNCSFTYYVSADMILNNLPFDSFLPLPSDYYRGYYSGIYFCNSSDTSGLDGQTLFELYDSSNADNYSAGFIACDFGSGGKSFSSSAVFNVILKTNNGFGATGEFGSGVVFYFTDGSSSTFSTADDYFSTIDLSSVSSKRVRRIVFFVGRGDISFFGLLNNAGYSSAYGSGFANGKSQGYSDGYSSGKTAGYGQGYNAGVESANNYSFLGLLGAVVDAPVKAISGLLNFNLLGFNMASFFYAILTLALIIAIIRLVV